jgi:hypothetical protein
MSIKKAKTFNSQVYSLACNRLKLKRREKIIFYRLLGFLIRNDNPFPYSIESLSANTGYSQSPIYECLNTLEKLRIIERVGFTSRVKFQKGKILKLICTLVLNRINNELNKNSSLVRIPEEFSPTSPDSGYKKTSSSLKHKETGVFSQSEIQQINWYRLNPEIKISKEDAYLFE